MEGLDAHIAQMQARLTSAIQRGEPENSPQVCQMEARLEQMRRLWATHRRIRLGQTESQEGEYVGLVR